LLITTAWSASACAQQQSRAPTVRSSPIRVIIETTRGSIVVDVDSVHAPITAANFLRYVDGGFYTGGRFHRTVTASNQPRDSVRIAVIQGGPNPERSASGFAPIVLERTNQTGLHHVDGTI